VAVKVATDENDATAARELAVFSNTRAHRLPAVAFFEAFKARRTPSWPRRWANSSLV
jgi:hypothetical protein